MRLCVVANGFQEDYMLHYLDSIAGRVDRIDFIGSSIYPESKIDKRITFYDLGGGGVEGLNSRQKFTRVVRYYFSLVRFFLKLPHGGVVHIQWLRFKLLDGIVLPLLYKALHYKVVYTVHDIVPHDRDTLYNRFVFKVIYKLNWKLIVHTEFLKTRLCREFNIADSKIKVLRHGVYEVSENLLKPQSDARQELGIKSDDFLFLFFGYITHYKGLDLLLEAFAGLDVPNKARLIIAGRSYENYRGTLDALRNKYSCEAIQFIIRKIEDHELPVLFGAADVTVIPYREASQSGVLFMSYAYGVPVIVPDIGGFPFDIVESGTGYLFKTGDVNDLREKLKKVIASKKIELMDNMAIRHYAHENYSWDKSGQELIRFINAE